MTETQRERERERAEVLVAVNQEANNIQTGLQLY